jgi:hypothetical protein
MKRITAIYDDLIVMEQLMTQFLYTATLRTCDLQPIQHRTASNVDTTCQSLKLQIIQLITLAS